ncbi:MAG: radical SAM protein [Nitrospirae bacterium]|nr:radical SAM protein [Nitrospirota bacterium]MBF0591120.1 radical SAM protein [Nitrospirota bacterium]
MDGGVSILRHPCFSAEGHARFGRIHLPVAPACNLACRYCVRKYDCANETRPGVTSRVLTPYEAFERLSILIEREYNKISVVGIAGPGDSLFNEATFTTLALIHREYPHLMLCVSTNGLLLSETLQRLIDAGVSTITVTINAVRAETAQRIYLRVSYGGRQYDGMEGSELVVTRQWGAVELAVEGGLFVKINTVLIPGINDHEVESIAREAAKRGVYIMNILPLIPQGEFKDIQRPGQELIQRLRRQCSLHIQQLNHCKQCRADAVGCLGEDKDMEFEVLMSQLGQEYCETI